MSEVSSSKISGRVGFVRPFLLAGGFLGVIGAGLFASGTLSAFADEQPKRVPATIHDTVRADGTQTAIFAGGCFWGMQGVFQHVQGVVNATSGYAGGKADTARYDLTETGATGHAEAVRIVFDPRKITYGKLLQIYFSVAHDPTEINRQGPDVGTQYRSVIFPVNEEQARIAGDYIGQLGKAGVFNTKIATTIEPNKPFYAAEAYHQDYMAHNPTQLYILFNEQPKVDNLKKFFPELYRETPVLVSDSQG